MYRRVFIILKPVNGKRKQTLKQNFYLLCLHIQTYWGPGGSMSQVVGLPNNSYKPYHQYGVGSRLCKLNGRWFSPGTLASSTPKTGRHDIAEILLKVALRHQKSKSVPKILSFKCHTNEQRSNKYTNQTVNQMFISVHNTMNVSKVIYKCREPILLIPVSNLSSILTLSTFTSL